MQHKNINSKEFEKKLPLLEKKYHGTNTDASYALQKLTNIHFRSTHLVNNQDSIGDIKNIYLFSAICLLILFVACMNYIILSTAQITNRFKETGIRKVFGAQRKALMGLILTESFVLLSIILPIAVILVHFLIPFVNILFSANLEISYIYDIKYIIGFLSIASIVGIISGSYLFLKLSRLNPVEIFNNRPGKGLSKNYLRNILVIFQLTIFIILVISSGTILRQLHYVQNADMGFNKDNIITIYINDTAFYKNYTSFKQEISKYPSIVNLTGCMDSPPLTTRGVSRVPHFQNENINILVDYVDVDFNYLETFEYRLLEGRSFSSEYPSDKEHAIIVNETAIKELGIIDPIGAKIKDRDIIGIVKDSHFLSFKEKISPMIFRIVLYRYLHEINVKVKPGEIPKSLTILGKEWNKFAPGAKFNYGFFESKINTLYDPEKNLGEIVTLASILSMLLAIMGLFGLSLFIAKQKHKEIGVRKIYGASSIIIMQQFSKEFILLAITANIISIPIAWFIMDKWLQNFAYHVTVGGMTFIISAFLSLFVLLVTISANTLKAANTNPVDIFIT